MLLSTLLQNWQNVVEKNIFCRTHVISYGKLKMWNKTKKAPVQEFFWVGKKSKVSCATAEIIFQALQHRKQVFIQLLWLRSSPKEISRFLWEWVVEAIMQAQGSSPKCCSCCRRSLLRLHSTPWPLNRLEEKKIFSLTWFCCQLGLPFPGSVLLWK